MEDVEEVTEIPGAEQQLLSVLHDQAEGGEDHELCDERFRLPYSEVQPGKAEADPQERVGEVVDPREEAHEAYLVEEVVGHKDSDCPGEADREKGPALDRLDPLLRRPDHHEERRVEEQERQHPYRRNLVHATHCLAPAILCAA